MRLVTYDEAACTSCPLAHSRHRIVSDEVGDSYSGVMLIGEAPGHNEDREGRPFVGASGHYLDALLEGAGLSREKVWLTNVVRCRPPKRSGGYTPLQSEIDFHRPFVEKSITEAQPRLIIAVGGIALRWFRPDLSITKAHGKPFYIKRGSRYSECCGRESVDGELDEYHTGRCARCHENACFIQDSIKVLPTFHPAYAMRNPNIWPLLQSDFNRLEAEPPQTGEPAYHLSSHREAVEIARASCRIGFDLETTDTLHEGIFYPHLQTILGYSVSGAHGEAIYVPEPPDAEMAAVLEDPTIIKVCHNAKFEYQLLQNHGITLRGFEDTKIKAKLLQHPSTRLKDLTLQLLDVPQLHLPDVLQGRSTSELTPEEWLPYAAPDADLTLRLDDLLTHDLRAQGLEALYYDFELPLVPILANAERRGVMLDTARLDSLAGGLRRRRAELGEKLQVWFPDVNLGSNQKVGEVLFGKSDTWVEVVVKVLKTKVKTRWIPPGLGLPVLKKTGVTGLPAVDKDVLERLKEKHECVSLLKEWRQIGDYLSDFIEKLPRIAVGRELGTPFIGADSRAGVAASSRWNNTHTQNPALHTSINQAGTWEERGEATKEAPVTGRFSSSGPNLMQIPKRDKILAKAIRSAFRARPGYLWVSADIAQEEPRLIAVASGDKQLLSDFNQGIDPYMEIAHMLKRVFTKDERAIATSTERDDWGLEYRDTAKNKVFLPVSYGAGPGKLSRIHPGMIHSLATRLHRALHDRYPGLVRYAEQIAKQVWETGYAVTHFERKRWLPGIWVKAQYEEAKRMAANMYPQGTGADVLKGCLIRLFGSDGSLQDYDAHFLFPVHDSIEAEVWEAHVPDVVAVLKNMTSWFTACVLPVEVKVGPSWGELKEA